MRAYLSRTGVGLLAGVAILVAVTGMIRGPRCEQAAGPRMATTTIGPFLANVERFEVRQLRDGVCVGSVQLHLWRPEGPVPVEQRLRIDGTASLGAGWKLRDRQWMVRNEYGRFPEGDTYYDVWLGAVPATQHAGETRAVLTFSFDPQADGANCPLAEQDLVLMLPGGETAVFSGLKAVAR